jgi:hypothetical protein
MPRKGEKAPWLKNVTAHTRPARGMGTNLPASGKIWDEGKPAKAFSADHQPPPGAQEAGKADAATLRELLSPHKRRVADTYLRIMDDAEAPHMAQLAAANAIADRLEGKVAPAPPPEGEKGPLIVVWEDGE